MRARLERGLIAMANVGDEVLERALDRRELALPAALARRHLARGDLALLVDLLLAHNPLVVLERQGRVDTDGALATGLLSVASLILNRPTTTDAAHREHARLFLAGAVVSVVAALADDDALRGLALARVIRLIDALVRRGFRLFELADLVV